MGDSRPPAAVIDLVDSFARRREGQVEIVLVQPEAPIGGNPFLVLRQGERKVKAPARLVEDGAERRLIATVPAGRNLRGTWALVLRSDSEPAVRLQARLLVQGPRRPVVLLWGARGFESRLPDPRPNPSPAPSQSSGPARAAAGKALSMLPERLRTQIRRVRG